MGSLKNRSCSHQLKLLVIVVWMISIVVSAVPVGAQPAVNVGQGTLFFIQNNGQFDSSTRFILEGSQSRLWLTDDGLWITWFCPWAGNQGIPADNELLTGVNLHISFLGADPHAMLQPLDRYATQVNYLNKGLSVSASTWHSVVYKGLYPGVDLIIDASNTTDGSETFSWRLEAGPTADLSQVSMRVEGADTMQVAQGHLVIGTAIGEFSLPLIHPELDRTLQLPFNGPHISNAEVNNFEVTMPFNQAAPPQSIAYQVSQEDLTYSTYLGGSAWEAGYGIALGPDGSIYVAGRTASTDFPTTAGAFDHSVTQVDAFIVKLNPTGERLVYATVLGGVGEDSAYGIALVGDQVYITGDTQSPDFPTTNNAFDITCGTDGTCNSSDQGPISDAFLTQLSSDGSQLIFSTFLGGRNEDHSYAVDVDGQGVYLTGITYSPDFPAPGYTSNGDAFIISFDSSHELAYASLLGGSDVDAGFGIAVRGGEAYITGETSSLDFPAQPYQGGQDLFLAHLSETGSLIQASLVGGSGNESGNSIDIDPSGNIAVAGWTTSPDLLVTSGVYGGNGDALILLVNSQMNVLLSTYFGGSNFDEGRGIATDSSGTLWITGFTTSTNLPTLPQAYQPNAGGSGDAFVANINPSSTPLGQFLYSTYLGGTRRDSGQALAHAEGDRVYLTGYTQSADFPMTSPNLDGSLSGIQDVFISSINPASGVGPTPSSQPPTPTLVHSTATASQVGTPQDTATPTPSIATATIVPVVTQPSSTPTTIRTEVVATPITKTATGTQAAVLQGSPSATGKVIGTLAATESFTPEAVKTQTSTPVIEKRQNVSSVWLAVPVLLVVIGLIIWFVYRKKRV